jgi:hypothetical protein
VVAWLKGLLEKGFTGREMKKGLVALCRIHIPTPLLSLGLLPPSLFHPSFHSEKTKP